MKIAIIGSHGYIGSFLYEQLRLDSNIELQAFTKSDRGLNQKNVSFIQGRDINKDIIQAFDIIIYTAGVSGFTSCSKYSLNQLIEENVDDIHEIVKKMLPSQVLIYLSTSVIYAGCDGSPSTENAIIDEDKLSNYGKSFYRREQLLQSLNSGKLQGLKCIGLRLGTVIGVSPIQNITRVYIAMLRDAFLKGDITCKNPGCMRPILDIWDLYKAILIIIQARDTITESKIYNINSFNASMLEIANEISKYTGDKIIEESDNESINFTMNNELFCNDFNFKFKGTHKTIIDELLKNIAYICRDDIRNNKHSSTCRVCSGDNLIPILDLYEQPLANNFTPEINNLKKHPLLLERCRDCNHTQLNYIVPPAEMFSHYLYSSGTSKTIIEYFKWFAQKCTNNVTKITNNVLELASNDGAQLDCFKTLGWNTYGVDPAINISVIATNKGHHIYNGFWGVDKFNIPVPDIIIAQNVFAHVPDPICFLKACVDIMTDNTKLYIQTSQCNMYITGEFDTIYHEHLSFFTGHSFKKAAEIAGLVIINFETTPIHGTSFLVTMQKPKIAKIIHCEQLWDRINYENSIGMTDDFFWIRYRSKAHKIAEWLRNNFFSMSDKYLLAAYGAAAKGMTLLNYINIPLISFIVDDSYLKQNTYSPGQNIYVQPTSYLREIEKPLAILILAWNFFDEIVKNIKTIRVGRTTLIVRPFPNQVIYSLTDTGLQELLSHTISYKNVSNLYKSDEITYYPEKIYIECVKRNN